MHKIPRMVVLLLSMVTMLTLSQCASYDFSRRVVQQGNLITKNKLDRLRVGMSKQDAAVLMGTSLLSPLFNNNRWDYVYTWRKGLGKMDKRTVVLYFKNNQLSRIEKNIEQPLHNSI